MSQSAEEIKINLQKKIVEIITSKLESGEINETRAKEIATMVLNHLPDGMSYEQLMQAIPKLDDHFEELTAAVVPIMVEYEQKMKLIVNQKISQLIKAGRLEDALNIAKKAVEFEKSLS